MHFLKQSTLLGFYCSSTLQLIETAFFLQLWGYLCPRCAGTDEYKT